MRWLSTLLRALLMIALIGAVAYGVLNAGSHPTTNAKSTATEASDCSSAGVSGVTLVVDFGSESNKPPLVTCAKNFTGTGWDIFAATGIKAIGTAQYPTAFVCQLNDFPAGQDCNHTPTYAEGSWVYYLATSDAPKLWLMSGAGASMRHPECGSYEGWVFVTAKTREAHPKPAVEPNAIKCQP